MTLVIYLDPVGLIKIDLISAPGQEEASHRFWHQLRPQIEALGEQAAQFSHSQTQGDSAADI